MTVFNNKSSVMLFNDPNSFTSGVIFPNSARVLSESDIQKKIKKTVDEIQHLSSMLPQRKTHGGKRFRVRKINLQNQVGFCAKRLLFLKAAKKIAARLNREQFVELMRNANGNINKLRMLLKGNRELCLKFFKHAVKVEDSVAQIQLSQAYFGMKWGNDDKKKTFSLVHADKFENFSYYPRYFQLLKSVYYRATGVILSWEISQKRSKAVFQNAANRGYLPAYLELMCEMWKWHLGSYGFAVQLRPYVGQGDKQIDLYFGEALKEGCASCSELYQEGLYWINQSKYSEERIPSKSQVFTPTRRFNCDANYAFGQFRSFYTETSPVRIAPASSYVFEHDPRELKRLVDENEIHGFITDSFIETPLEGPKNRDFCGNKRHGFRISSLRLSQGPVHIGKISVREDTLEIYQTIHNTALKPLIDFIENVMIRSGSASSAHDWLRQMGVLYM